MQTTKLSTRLSTVAMAFLFGLALLTPLGGFVSLAHSF